VPPDLFQNTGSYSEEKNICQLMCGFLRRSGQQLLVLLCLFSLARASSSSVLPSVANNQVLGAGAGFSAILQKDGTVWTVGTNLAGQLGDGYTGGSVSVPVKVVNLTNITAISLNANCGLALKNDGTVWAWGDSTTGQLGAGATTAISNVAVQVTGLPAIRAISNGYAHCLAIGVDGTVWAWGSNASGQLGSTAGSSATPAPVAGLSNIIAVAAGYSHSLVLTSAGTVFAFGDNTYGELGRTGAGGYTPTLVSGLSHITAISAYTQSLALTSGGTGLVWGSTVSINYGSAPESVGLSHLKMICAEGTNSAAIDSSGNLYLNGPTVSGFGWSSSGAPLFGQEITPVQIPLPGVTATAGSGEQVLAISEGTVKGWGAIGTAVGTGNTAFCAMPMDSLLGDSMGISQVATGSGFTLALYRDGTVHAVGRNDFGQLGNGTTGSPTSTDAPIPGLTGIIAIAAGEKFGAALSRDGTVWTWGCNDYGQLGNGTTLDSYIPIHVAGPALVTQIAAGNNHIIALQPNLFTEWVWGRNNHGQLGIGNTTQQNSPYALRAVYLPGGHPILVQPTQIAAAGDHSMVMGGAVSFSYSVAAFSWGDNTYGEIGNGTTTDVLTPYKIPTLVPSEIATGSNHTLLLSGSNLYAWGDDEDGELGDGGSTARSTPELIALPAYPSAIFAGNHTGYFIDAYNDLLSWGLNTTGQLGQNTTTNVSTPQYSDADAIAVSSFAGHLIALSLQPTTNGGNDGSVILGCGDNSQGQLDAQVGSSTSYPVESDFQDNYSTAFMALSGGQRHSLALDYSGALWAWGDNSLGQLGDGTTISQFSPEENFGGMSFSRLSAGSGHSAAIDQTGTFFTWGLNTSGQLANGTTTSSTTPAPISLTGMKDVSAGANHTLSLRDDGTVWAAGDNTYGELGDGTTMQRPTPVQVSGLSGIKAIAAGTGFSLALRDDGTVWAWGLGSSNQLGNNTMTSSSSPVQIPALSAVISVAAGGAHGLAILANGRVATWGSNDSGQLGIGTFSSTGAVSQIADAYGTPIVGASVAAGDDFSAVLRPDGTVVESGDDQANQLGDNAYINESTPQANWGISGLGLIAAGSAHVLSQHGDGSGLENWGDNAFGELGNGQTFVAPPQPPTSVVASLNGTAEIDVTWVPSGVSALNYLIEASSDGGYTWTGPGTAPGTATSYAATSLAPGSSYQFRVSAINTGGESSPVLSSLVSTPFSVPSSPTNLSVSRYTPGVISLNWTNNGPTDTSILIQQKNADGSYTTIATAAGTTTSYTVTSVVGSVPGSYRVVAANSAGSQASADSAAVAAAPIPIYGIIRIGSAFYPDYISNAGVLTGQDASYKLARWSNFSVTELTDQSLPVQYQKPLTYNGSWAIIGYGANSNGDVVSTYYYPIADTPFTGSGGLHWGASTSDTSPLYSPGITLTEGYDLGVEEHPDVIQTSYTAITDSGIVYGAGIAAGDGFIGGNIGVLTFDPGAGLGSYSPYPGGYFIYPGNSAPPKSVTLSIPEGPIGITFALQSDGFSYNNYSAPTELGNTSLPPTLTSYPTAPVYPILATNGVLITSSTSYLAPPYNVGGTQLGFNPISANDSGSVVGSNAGGTYLWSYGQGNQVLSSSSEDVVTGINNRYTNGIPDFQIVGTNQFEPTIWEKQRDARGNPVGTVQPIPLDELIDDEFTATGINDSGEMVGTDDTGAPALAFPCELAVDADRNGTIVMANDVGANGNLPVDTTENQPFRFWVNDGIDGFDSSGVEKDLNPATGIPNCQQSPPQITCSRDLENFSRLWLYMKGIDQAVASGTIIVGLEWQNTSGSPAINVYKAAPPSGSDIVTGGTDYLTDPASAQVQSSAPYQGALGSVTVSHPFYFSAGTFAGLSDASPKTYFLFEGAGRGVGSLVVTFNTMVNGVLTQVGTGGQVAMDLREIQEFYERWTVGDGPVPTTFAAGGGGAPEAMATISQDRLPSDITNGLQYTADPGLSVASDLPVKALPSTAPVAGLSASPSSISSANTISGYSILAPASNGEPKNLTDYLGSFVD
jgi:alpha-tubulin suppressor-like RCC1 family protein